MRIADGNDDVEQRTTDGAMYLDSTDLELGDDPAHWGEQAVGLRFPGVGVPQGATIAAAYVEFETDEVSNDATSLVIQGQAADDAPAFTLDVGNLTSRPTVASSVPWATVPAWVVNSKQRTPDLAPIVQQIVNRPGWATQHALVVIIDGTGRRTAEAVEGEAAAAPLLHVEYIAP